MATQSWAELMAKAEVPTGGGGKVLPKGTYRCTIKSRKADKSAKGKDRLAVLLEVTEGPEKGEKFWDNLYVSPESPVALGIFFQQFERLGGSLDTLKMGGSLEAASASIPGRTIDAILDVEEYPKGQVPPNMRNKVSAYRVVAPGSTPPITVPAGPPVTAPAAAQAAPGIGGSPF